ncbi:MAG: hypothetical protein E7266_00465 [Lachnospiraceae bacterium]|nr:hypothetical protein [Lachnospiraceae bacterium]
MKRLAKILSVICLFVFVCVCDIDETYAAGATLTGDTTVRAGDTITLKLNVSDTGKVGFEGELSFDSSKVSYSSIEAEMNGWLAEKEGNNLVIYDNNLTNPVSGNKTVATIKFKVSSNVKTGDKIEISVKNFIGSDGSSESDYGTVTYSVTVAAPLSTNANLSALSIDGITLSPTFAPGTTTYNAGEVEYAKSSVSVKYTTEDAKAKVKVSGTNLSVGNNKITVTVTAESGAKKTYTINITRKQNPNYVASSDATLKSMTVSIGEISPKFSATHTDYIVYLPYEYVGKSFTVSGSNKDAKGSVKDGTIKSLTEGANTVEVVGKAEDGTEKKYKVTVYVMPSYDGSLPTPGGNDQPGDQPDEPSSEEATTKKEETTTGQQNTSPVEELKDVEDNSISPFVIVVLVVIAAAMGFAGCYLLLSKNILK